MATIHIKYRNNSRDIELQNLFPQEQSIDNLSDTQIKNAVASYLDIGVSELDGYIVDRHANGNATVRPQAEFG